MTKVRRGRPPKPESERTSPHSFRVKDRVWNAAKTRAHSEGKTMSGVIAELMEGYAAGKLHMPKIAKTFTNTATVNAPKKSVSE